MVKLPRVTQKIFSGNAQPTETAVFGTMRTQNPVYTGDIAQIMGGAAFTQGWQDAVEEGFAPFMEEMNGIQKCITQQQAYQFEQGISEWDEGTTYYMGSVVKVPNESTGDIIIYTSLANDNIGNQPAAGSAYWKVVFDSSISLYLGYDRMLTQGIVSMPSGIPTYDTDTHVMTAPAGNVYNVANGMDAQGNNVSVRITLPANVTRNMDDFVGVTGKYFVYLITAGLTPDSFTIGAMPVNGVYREFGNPRVSTWAINFNLADNRWYEYNQSTSTWVPCWVVIFGEATFDATSLKTYYAYRPTNFLTQFDYSRIMSIMNTELASVSPEILDGGTNFLRLKSSTGTIYKVQWGAQQVVSNGTQHITFPIAFSSQNYSVSRSGISTSGEGITYRVVCFSNNLTTGIDFYATTLTPWVFWIAMGI